MYTHTIYREKEKELETLEKTPFEFDQKVTPTPTKRPVVRRKAPVNTKQAANQVSEAAQKQFRVRCKIGISKCQ